MKCTGGALVVAWQVLCATSSRAQPPPPSPPPEPVPAVPSPGDDAATTAPAQQPSPPQPAQPQPVQPPPPPAQQQPQQAPQPVQSQPPAPPPAPEPRPVPWTYAPATLMPREPEPPKPRTYRNILGFGVSGTLKPDWDQRFTIATELERNIHTSRFHFGWNIHWSFRNWSVIKSVYQQIGADDVSPPAKAFGYVFGWMSGTSMLGGGWQARYAQQDGRKAWALLGTRLILFLDPIEGGEGDEVDAAFAHALHGAIGYDLDTFGLGLRAMWAPDVFPFGSTDSAPLFLMMATVEFRKE